MMSLCPHCRGPVEREVVGRSRIDSEGVPCIYCAACDLVTLIRPQAYDVTERRDLA